MNCPKDKEKKLSLKNSLLPFSRTDESTSDYQRNQNLAKMIIGVPKEIKNNENRVALTPSGANELVKRGNHVCIQTSAGGGSDFPTELYKSAGAEVLPTIEDVYAKADIIVKVTAPIAPEYDLIRKAQVVFPYFLFASHATLT